jgi:hypothetical protein
MAAYYKVDVVLNSQAVSVGLPSPQSVRVTLPLVGPQGPVGPPGEQGPPGEVSGSLAWDNVTDKPTTFPPEAHTHQASEIVDFTAAVEAVSPPADWDTLANKPASFTPSAHGSSHHTGGADALAPNNISAAWAEVLSSQSIAGDTLLAAGRSRRISVGSASAVTANIDLPYENNQAGDVVTLVGAIIGPPFVSIYTIRRAAQLAGVNPIAYSTLATINAAGQAFTFVSDGTQTGWSLRAVDTHTHTASQVTDFNTAAAAAAPVQSVNGSTGTVTVAVPSASTATPQALGTAAAGTSDDYSRGDHVHAAPALNDLSNVSAATPSDNDVLVFDTATSTWVAEAAATVDLASPPAIGNTTPAAGSFTTLAANSGTITANAPLSITQTWNNAAVVFTALEISVTNTAASTASRLLFVTPDGGSQYFMVNRVGGIEVQRSSTTVNGISTNARVAAGAAVLAANHTVMDSNGFNLASNRSLLWSSTTSYGGSPDLRLERDAAATLGQRDGTNAQTFRLYNTFTSDTNFERLSIGWASNIVSIKPEAGGSGGAVRELHISGLPTSNPGPGILWDDGGTVKVGT